MHFKKIQVGVMQGRLLPQINGMYQAHPIDNWEKEFFLARDLSLDCIEFIIDKNSIKKNPLMNKKGIDKIKKIIKKTNVKVHSICADIFMDLPLHSPNKNLRLKSLSILKKIIYASLNINIKYIIIPCVDRSKIKNINQENLLIKSLNSASKINNKIKLLL